LNTVLVEERRGKGDLGEDPKWCQRLDQTCAVGTGCRPDIDSQLEIVDSLTTLLEGHGSRVIDVEDEVEQGDFDLPIEHQFHFLEISKCRLTRSIAISMGNFQSAAIFSRAPEEATLAAIMSSEPGG
jgi:hypothetical protein